MVNAVSNYSNIALHCITSPYAVSCQQNGLNSSISNLVDALVFLYSRLLFSLVRVTRTLVYQTVLQYSNAIFLSRYGGFFELNFWQFAAFVSIGNKLCYTVIQGIGTCLFRNKRVITTNLTQFN